MILASSYTAIPAASALLANVERRSSMRAGLLAPDVSIAGPYSRRRRFARSNGPPFGPPNTYGMRGVSDRTCYGIAASGHLVSALNGRTRSVLAGAAAATVWGLQEPLDKRLFRCDYSDVAVLGKAVTRGASWRVAGLGIHAVNGAVFGLLFHEVRRRVSLDPRRLALGMALTEHLALYPLSYFVDRLHPARGESGVPRLLTNPRAFGQATWRHALFGALLGRLT